MQHEALELVDILHAMVTEAWGVPLGNDKCIVERERVLEILEEIKANLPIELAEAKRLVASRDEFIANARREAESLRKVSEEHARRMVEDQEVVKTARSKSSEMLSSAENKARELKRLANEYVDDALRRTEEAVSAALDEVRQQRVRFRTAVGGKQTPVAADDEDDLIF